MHAADATNELSAAARRMTAGGRALFVAQCAKFAVRTISAMALARLLTPDDYGVFGMAAAVHGLLNMMRDLGTGAAVQQAGLTRERFDALCRLGLIGGIVLGVLCAALGPAAAHFYAEPRLPTILAGLAVCFPLAGAAAPLQSLLFREQHVATAARIDAAALTLSCVAALAAAAAGARTWALVTMAVVNEFAALVLFWRASSWRPRLRSGAMPWSSLLTFSAHLSGHSVAGYIARTCDQIVLGRTAGAEPLGIYGRGVQATTLPMQFSVAPFTGWIIASLARVQSDSGAYRARFRSALNGLAHLTLPLAAACVALPELVVAAVFGARWQAAVPVVRWLGLGLAVQPWAFAHTWLLISVGRSRLLFGVSLFTLATFLGAVVAAGHAGLVGMAGAVAAASWVTTIGTLVAALGATPACASDVWHASWRPWLLHGGLGLGWYYAGRFLSEWSILSATGCLGLLSVAFLAMMLVAWKGARTECRNHFLWER